MLLARVRITDHRTGKPDELAVLAGSTDARDAVDALVVSIGGARANDRNGVYDLPFGALSYVEDVLRGAGVAVERRDGSRP